MFSGNDCSDVKVFFGKKDKFLSKYSFLVLTGFCITCNNLQWKNSEHCEHKAFDEERIMKDRNQYGEWRGVGPSSYLGPRLAVRDGRGSYIMSTGMLISVPFTDTLTRHDDTMIF